MTAITKYKFLINGHVAASALAKTKELATKKCKRLFGKDSKIEFVGEEFSHNVGDYKNDKECEKGLSVSSCGVVSTPISEKRKTTPKKTGFDSVIEEYAKHGRVDL